MALNVALEQILVNVASSLDSAYTYDQAAGPSLTLASTVLTTITHLRAVENNLTVIEHFSIVKLRCYGVHIWVIILLFN